MLARLAGGALAFAALVAPLAAAAAAPPTAPETAAYTAVTPCRLLDSRLVGGALPSDASIALDVTGVCGVPESATAVAVTLTVAGVCVTAGRGGTREGD